MKVSQFNAKDPNQTGRLELENPLTGEKLLDEKTGEPIWIKLYGPESDTYKRIQRNQSNKTLRQATRGGTIKVSAEEVEGRILELIGWCTAEWKGIEDDAGPIECTPDNALKVYKECPWIREQVLAFINDRSNFLGN